MKPQNSTLGAAIAAAGICVGASSASADVSGLQFRLTEQAAEIIVISDADLGTPRVRTQSGEVKVWFPDVRDNARVTAAGDGAVVSRARLRPGKGSSAVLDIDVAGRRHVAQSEVTVEHQAGATIVRFPRPNVAARAANTENRAANTTNTAKTNAAKASEAVAVAPSTLSSVAKEVPASAAAGAVAERLPDTLGTKPAKPAAKVASTIASGGESKLPALMGLTAALALLLGAIKLWQRKSRSFMRDPDIHVVAHKRLAPGLQLFIVRAFGKEHLLSVNGKTTERLATNEAFEDLSQDEREPERTRFKLPNDRGVELIPSRSVLAPSAPPKRSHARTEFPGLDLPLPLSKAPLTASQSVAGLIRLREQLDRVN